MFAWNQNSADEIFAAEGHRSNMPSFLMEQLESIRRSHAWSSLRSFSVSNSKRIEEENAAGVAFSSVRLLFMGSRPVNFDVNSKCNDVTIRQSLCLKSCTLFQMIIYCSTVEYLIFRLNFNSKFSLLFFVSNRSFHHARRFRLNSFCRKRFIQYWSYSLAIFTLTVLQKF